MQTRDVTDDLYCTRVRNQAKTCCRRAEKNFGKKIARNAKQNLKAFFVYARSKLKTKDGVADLSDVANKVSSDEGKANILHKFSAVFLQRILQTSLQVKRETLNPNYLRYLSVGMM